MASSSERIDLSERSDFFLELLDDTRAWRERLVEELTFGSAAHVRVVSGYQIDFPPDLVASYAELSQVRTANVLLPLTTREKRPLLNLDLTGPAGQPAALTARASTAALQALYLRRLAETSAASDALLGGVSENLLEAICVFTPALFEDHFLNEAGDDVEKATLAYLRDGLKFPLEANDVRRWRKQTRAAGDLLAERLEEGESLCSSSEELLLALPRMDPLPGSIEAVDEIVGNFEKAVVAADEAGDDEFAVVLAEYGRRFEVVIESGASSP